MQYNFKRLTSEYGPRLEIDADRFYENNCRYREPPSEEVLQNARIVGFSFIKEPESDSTVYLSFFILGWGMYCLNINPKTDPDFISRYTALYIMDVLAES